MQDRIDRLKTFAATVAAFLAPVPPSKAFRLAGTLELLQDLLPPAEFARMVETAEQLIYDQLTLTPGAPPPEPTAPAPIVPPPTPAPGISIAGTFPPVAPHAPTLVEEPLTPEEQAAERARLAPALEAIAPIPAPMPTVPPPAPAPTAPTPAPPKPKKKAPDQPPPDPAKLTAQISLANMLGGERITFEQFAKWGEEAFGGGNVATGFIDWRDVHGFFDLSEKAANWFLANIYYIAPKIRQLNTGRRYATQAASPSTKTPQPALL